MYVDTTWTTRPDETAACPGARGGQARLSFPEIILQLWRAKWLMLLVFLPIFLLGLGVALMMPKHYEATSRLYISLGEEYVYRPRVGAAVAGIVPEQDQVIHAELELLQSPVVAQRVLRRFPLERLYPSLAARRAEMLSGLGGDARAAADYTFQQLGIEALTKDFAVRSAPKTPVIHTSFKHRDAGVSAEVLNAMIGAYLLYRSEIFNASKTDIFSQQRKAFELDLLAAEGEIRRFLVDNSIGDFEAERVAAQTLFAAMSGDMFKTRSRISALRGQVATLDMQMTVTDPLVDIYVEDLTEQVRLDLQLERQQLLSQYTPQSRPVMAMDLRITQVETYLETQTGAVGTVRRGPNPVYQSIETSKSALDAELAALENQQRELLRQRADIEARQMRVADLEPRWRELLRERDLLTSNVETFAAREIEARARTSLAHLDADNIRVLEPAIPPAIGTSLKLPVALLALLFAGFTALMAGLLKVFTGRELSTSASVERVTGLPVISVADKRRP